MTLSTKRIPGLPEEATRALSDVQDAVRRECARLEEATRRPRRRVTELVEQGSVIARPGEVTRVAPSDEDVTVVLPEPSAASDGQDIIVSFEGPGTGAGRVLVVPANGTCLAPGIQTLNAPGTYRFTSTGGGQTPKPRNPGRPYDATAPDGGAWSGPPPIVVDDLPPIGPDELDGSVAGDGLTGGGGTPLTVGAGDGIDVGADSIAVDVTDIAGAGLESDGSNNLRIASSAAGAGLIGGGGSALAVGAGTGVTVNANDVAVTTPLTDGDKGDITVSSNGTVFTIDNDVVSNAKLRNSAGLSVIGRSTNSTGDPADITSTTARHALMTNSAGTAIGWRALETADIPAHTWAQVLAAGATSGANNPVVDNGQYLGFGASPPTLGLGEQIRSDGNFLGYATGQLVWVATSVASMQGTAAQLTATTGDATVSAASGNVALNTSASGFVSLPSFLKFLAEASASTPTMGAGQGLVWVRNDTPNVPMFTDDGNTDHVLQYRGEGMLADGDKGDITVSGSFLTWTIDNGVVSNAKLANMAERRIKGRADSAGTGDPTDLTGAQVGAIVRFGNFVGDTTTTGTVATHTVAASTNMLTFNAVTNVIHGFSTPTEAGQRLIIQHIGAGTTTLVHESSTATSSTDRMRIGDYASNTAAIILDDAPGLTAEFIHDGSRWIWVNGAVAEASIPLSKLANQSDDTFLANIAGASGPPSAVALTTLAGAGLTGGADAILNVGAGTGITVNANDVAVTTPLTDGDKGDITVASSGTSWTIDNDVVSNAKLANVASPSLKGRTTASTGDPEDLTLVGSTSVTWNTATGGSISLERAALTGDVTASANSNTTTIANDVVSDAKLRNSGALSVIGRSANSSGDPADISAANDGEVLRRSGTTLGFGTIATAGLANNAVTNAKLATMTAATIKGRAMGAGTGDPTDLTQTQVSDMFRLISGVTDTPAPGTFNDYAVADTTKLLRINPSSSGDVTITGFAMPGGNTGGWFRLFHQGSSGVERIVLAHANAGSSANNQLILPEGASYILDRFGDCVDLQYIGGRWQVVSQQINTQRITDNAVSDAKLRDSAALSVIGRSANSTGDPADISAGTDGHVLRRSGTTLGFGTIATGGITDAAVTLAKMADLAQSRIIGRAEGGGTGVPQALTPTQVVAIIDGEDATWTGAHTFNGASLTANVGTADVLLGANPGGIGLFAGQSTTNVTNGDLVLNATGGVGIQAGGSAVTNPDNGQVEISASDLIQMLSPTLLSHRVRFNAILSSSMTGNIDDLDVSAVNVVRLTPDTGARRLRGMAPGGDGQHILLVNTSTSFSYNLVDESDTVDGTSSTAANRFRLPSTTTQTIPASGSVLMWYDGTTSRWRMR